MVTEPSTDDLTFVPRGVIPNQYEGRDRLSNEMLTTSTQKVDGDPTSRTTIHETQQHLICLLGSSQQQSITGESLGIGILFAPFFFLQPGHVIFVDPAVLIRLS